MIINYDKYLRRNKYFKNKRFKKSYMFLILREERSTA